MPKKKNIYEKCCIEIVNICKLVPGWSLKDFIEDEKLDVNDGKSLYDGLKMLREQLDIVREIISDDEETERIMEEGIRIHNIIISEQLYGED